MAVPQIGVFLPTMSDRSSAPGDVVAAARHAERLGFESVWAVDQLVAGTGVPMIESTVALAAAAGATSRVRLGYGVLILPLRATAWVAKQVASLQLVSGGRVLLGVGVGGDRHDGSWAAVGVPRRQRGARTDAALRALPDLLAGRPATLEDQPGRPLLQLAPGVPAPPVLVGGASDAAMARALHVGDGWFLLPVGPDEVAVAVRRMGVRADTAGVRAPAVTASTVAALTGDAGLPGRDELLRLMTDPDGVYGMPAEAAPHILALGGPEALAERLVAYGAAGAERVVVTLVAGDWHRQAELLAEAVTAAAQPAAKPGDGLVASR